MWREGEGKPKWRRNQPFFRAFGGLIGEAGRAQKRENMPLPAPIGTARLQLGYAQRARARTDRSGVWGNRGAREGEPRQVEHRQLLAALEQHLPLGGA